MKIWALSVLAIFFTMSAVCQTTGTGTGSSAGTQSSNNQQTITKPPLHKIHPASTLRGDSRIHATNTRNNGMKNTGSEAKSTTASTSHSKTSASKRTKNHTSEQSTKVHGKRSTRNTTDSSGR
jgi:hypothetical protein